MKLKDHTVVYQGFHSEMLFALGIADMAFTDEKQDCIVTAGQDGRHNPGSLHPLGLAVDIRCKQLSEEQRDRIFAKIQRLEDYGFDVVYEREGDTAMTTAVHYHIEFQPKLGETFWKLA